MRWHRFLGHCLLLWMRLCIADAEQYNAFLRELAQTPEDVR